LLLFSVGKNRLKKIKEQRTRNKEKVKEQRTCLCSLLFCLCSLLFALCSMLLVLGHVDFF